MPTARLRAFSFPKEDFALPQFLRPLFLAAALVAGIAAPGLAASIPYSERALGSPDAKVTIVEYSSLLCPHCADFHTQILPELKKEYIDTGKVRLVFKDHSLGQPLAVGASVIARCAPEQNFFPLITTLFANQRTWATAKDLLAALQGYAALAGMDKAAVEACLDNQDVFNGVQAGEAEAGRIGVESTPSFVIDGKPVLVGAQPIEAFRKVLDPLVGG
ncbi:disulfide bond formation protein DsbA [Rhodospirillum rubrum]|nr:disulfide bond formation protein DsbA [Rhodospirillum rubrum]